MDRRLLVCCCVVLVALAGCSGGPSASTTTDPEPTGTSDPAPTTDTTDAGPSTAANLNLSMGATVDASALAAAHAAALADGSYTFRSGYGLGTGARERAATVVRADGPLFEVERFQYHPARGEAAALYVREGTEYVRFEAEQVRKTVARPTSAPVPNGSQTVAGPASLTVTDTVQRDGETRYVLTADYDYDDPERALPYRRAVVGESGRIYNYTSGEYVPQGSERRYDGVLVQRWFEVDAVGTTTVAEPDWLTDRRTTERDGPVTTVVEHAALDVRFRVTGTDVGADVERVRNDAVVGSDHVDASRASPLVALDVAGDPTNATVSVGYDPTELPDGADEAGLSVFVYNESLQTYLPLNTTLDEEANVAVASRGAPVTYRTGGGPEQRFRPTLADSTADRPVVTVMHVETWYEAFRP